MFDEVQTRPYASRLGWQFPDQYPMVAQGITGYNSYNLDNIQPANAVGIDRHSQKPFYNHSMMDGKSYMEDGGRTKIMENHANRNLYDFYSTHLNRHGARMFTCNFNIFEQQAVRVQVRITYKVDPGIFLNTRSGTPPVREQMILLIYDHFGRAIPGTREQLPLQETVSEYTYDKTVTLAPGLFSVVLNGRKDGHYNHRIMTFSRMSCVVSGAKPREIEISHNGFHEYLLLDDPSKAVAGYLTKEGTEPIINNPARTTIRFRKIRF